ncbi:30S ribosomal protein S20 [bacterium]|nr:30S ribosomal protein S20 [bacterium]
MAVRKRSGIEEARKSIARREQNRFYKSLMKTSIKKAVTSVGQPEHQEMLNEAISRIDKAAKRNVIDKNNAANKKSKLMRKLNKLTATA